MLSAWTAAVQSKIEYTTPMAVRYTSLSAPFFVSLWP